MPLLTASRPKPDGPIRLAALAVLLSLSSAQAAPAHKTAASGAPTPTAPAPAAAPAATAPSPATAAAPAARRSEQEFLVPPGGGAFEVPVHAGAVCILSFFEKLDAAGLASSPDFEVRAWGPDGIAVRGNANAKPMTLAVATATRAVKLNVTFRVVPATAAALTLVRFRAATEEEARDKFVADELARRMAPLRAAVEADRKNLDALVEARAEALVMERSLKRSEVRGLKSIERNDANVIASVKRAMVLGDQGYLYFEVENRGLAPFRLARLAVTSAGKPLPSRARLFSTTIDKDPRMIGVVPPGATARGVVAVPAVDAVMTKGLALELAGPEGRDAFRLTRGISFK